MVTLEQKIESYAKHKNLKVAAAELGMSFQTLYWQLKKAGVSVTGDKERWGSVKDRFGVHAEKIFHEIVPHAQNNNDSKFQAKCDFIVSGIKVEIKASKRQALGKGSGGDRWMFSIKRQNSEADFFVMFAFSPDASLEKVFLIPAGVIVCMHTISICVNGKSKWHAYEVSLDQLRTIFDDLSELA